MALACVRVSAALVLWSTVLSGCGDSSSDAKPVARVCTPGTVYDCVRGGCSGRQSCNATGTAMSRCFCDGDYDDPAADGDSGPSAAGRDAASERDAGSDAGKPSTAHERCDNGEDDDDDGDIDCADDDCKDVSCVAGAPDDWQGPVALRQGAELGPDCSGAFDQQAFSAGRSPISAAISCSTCSCSSGAGCASFVDFGTGTDSGCGGTTCTTSVNQSCAEITPPCLTGLSTAYLKTKLSSAASSCTPSQQNPSKPDVHWEMQVRACRDDSARRAGCGTAQLCLPKSPGSDFAAGYCVWREGEHECPTATYTHKQTYHREFEDTRACSDCSCGGPSCSYSWKVFNSADTSCATPLLEVSEVDQCVQVNPSSDKLRVGATISGDGHCAPSGGSSSGAITATKPITVCCSE